nr:DNA-binding protein [Pseudomonas otitidis]
MSIPPDILTASFTAPSRTLQHLQRRIENMRERIVAILEHKKLTAKKLEELSGVDREKWYALRKGGRRVNEDDIKVIVELAPEYALWLVSGKIAPECGQTSPEYDQANATDTE